MIVLVMEILQSIIKPDTIFEKKDNTYSNLNIKAKHLADTIDCAWYWI